MFVFVFVENKNLIGVLVRKVDKFMFVSIFDCLFVVILNLNLVEFLFGIIVNVFFGEFCVEISGLMKFVCLNINVLVMLLDIC